MLSEILKKDICMKYLRVISISKTFKKLIINNRKTTKSKCNVYSMVYQGFFFFYNNDYKDYKPEYEAIILSFKNIQILHTGMIRFIQIDSENTKKKSKQV